MECWVTTFELWQVVNYILDMLFPSLGVRR